MYIQVKIAALLKRLNLGLRFKLRGVWVSAINECLSQDMVGWLAGPEIPGGAVMAGRTKGTKTTKASRDDSMEMDDMDTEAEVEQAESTKPAKPKPKITPYRITTGEAYMNDEQLVHFRDILLGWRYDLMQEVDHTITEMKEAGVLADPNDRATQEETFNLELRTRDRERKLIKKIEEALQKIKDKEYGYCEACGIEIGVRRLEARPTATLCIDCKTLAEIQEKRA